MITDLTRSAPAESRPFGACPAETGQVHPGRSHGPVLTGIFVSGAAQKKAISLIRTRFCNKAWNKKDNKGAIILYVLRYSVNPESIKNLKETK